MSLDALVVQLLNGLAEASSLFLVAAGLSLIFGVTRIVNFAHGSFYMLGVYVAWSLAGRWGVSAAGFWGSVLLASALVGVLGALLEVAVLRRLYRAPELFQLLATFALVLVINDAAMWIWGAEDLLGPRSPGLAGSVGILGRQYPTYNFALMAIGPIVLGLLWMLLTRTRWGRLVRAATEDRDMLGALGVNQAWLFTGVFALGALLAGLGGAVQLPREPASLSLDLRVIGDAFVVVVVGGMGSIPGAFVAALVIAIIKAVCIGLGTIDVFGAAIPLSRWTLIVEFVVMALVLVVRPWGLFGRAQAPSRHAGLAQAPFVHAGRPYRVAMMAVVLLLASVPAAGDLAAYTQVLLTDIFIAVLFALSLHFIMGPAGMHSFGHAAYFGLGAYGAALLVKQWGMPTEGAFLLAPLVAAGAAVLFGWFVVRLSGVYLAMLTLAFAQIVWSVVFQWDGFTGGSNGLIGLWPPAWLASSTHYYYLTLVSVVLAALALRRILFSPFGYAMRAARDSPLRAAAIGIDIKRVQWLAFVIAGLFGGLAGALFVFSKGGISPDVMSVGKSVDALVMVLLGGVQSLTGPILGAATFGLLQDTVMRSTEYWRALLGGIILLLVLVFPQGLAGMAQLWRTRATARGVQP